MRFLTCSQNSRASVARDGPPLWSITTDPESFLGHGHSLFLPPRRKMLDQVEVEDHRLTFSNDRSQITGSAKSLIEPFERASPCICHSNYPSPAEVR
jgi:hypothetical protein